MPTGGNLYPPRAVIAARFSVNRLTPVERREGIYFKREDLFKPFAKSSVNGGKVRQCLALLQRYQPVGVVSASSIHSPQCAIVSACCSFCGVPCEIILGGRRETPYVRIARYYGALIHHAPTGRHTVLFHYASTVQKQKGYQLLKFGFYDEDLTGPAVRAIARQVRNLPANLANLIITCGSANTAIGVLRGLSHYCKRVDNVFLVGTGPGRSALVNRAISQLTNALTSRNLGWRRLYYYNLFDEPKFRYERPEPFAFCGVQFHPLYEAKAFRWAVANIRWRDTKTAFWVIGSDFRDLEPSELGD